MYLAPMAATALGVCQSQLLREVCEEQYKHTHTSAILVMAFNLMVDVRDLKAVHWSSMAAHVSCVCLWLYRWSPHKCRPQLR